MLNFRNFSQLISRIKRQIASKIRNLFKKLSFGSSQTIKIDIQDVLVEALDTKSRLGYYSEYVTGYNLAKTIQENGGNLKNTNINELKNRVERERSFLLSLDVKNINKEVDRMDSAGIVLANSIFNDIVINGEDFNTLYFEVQMTGDSQKGKSKSDLILTVSKMSENDILDRILASLKAYKKSTINLANTTFTSLFKTLLYNDIPTPNSTEKFVEQFISDYGSETDVRRLRELQNIIIDLMGQGQSKEESRKQAKNTYFEVRELLKSIFEKAYSQNKELINRRLVSLLGFDTDEDFYAAIGDSGKQKVISSRQSEGFKTIISKLQNSFNVQITNEKSNKIMKTDLTDPAGNVIISINVTFTDTGGDSPQGKTNWFVNLKDLL